MSNDKGLSGVLGYIFSGRVLKRNLTVSLIVGCILSMANQYDALLNGPYTAGLGMKILFNYLVPFTVSSVSAAINREKKI